MTSASVGAIPGTAQVPTMAGGDQLNQVQIPRVTNTDMFRPLLEEPLAFGERHVHRIPVDAAVTPSREKTIAAVAFTLSSADGRHLLDASPANHTAKARFLFIGYFIADAFLWGSPHVGDRVTESESVRMETGRPRTGRRILSYEICQCIYNIYHEERMESAEIIGDRLWNRTNFG